MSWFTDEEENKPKGVPIIEEATGIKLWPAGVPRGGRMKKGERPAGAKLITKENAAFMHARRREIAQQKAAEGQRIAAEKYYKTIMKNDGKSLPRITDYDAWALVNEKMAGEFFKSTSLKSMSDAMSVMGRASGMLEERGDKQEQANELPIHGIEDARVLLQIINIYESGEKPKPPDIIDAEVL
jgi:hypothetical protein